MVSFCRKILLFTVVIMISLSALQVRGQVKEETITKSERDIILLMCALENPNYDIVLVIDVSGSMSKVLLKWRMMAEKTVDIAQLGDTLVLIKFDSTPKDPIIQKIEKERDKELFMGNVRKTFTTSGWGTDINCAYWLTLKTLKGFNEGRKKVGEPIRLAHVVFISDGDDLPPEKSPFRNPGSPETLELADLIKEAQRQRIINIIPIGMEFKDYVPQTRRIKNEGSTSVDEKINKELKEFMDKLQNMLNRPYEAIKDDQEKVPKSPYQFYIDWLSNRLELKRGSDLPQKNPYKKTVSFLLSSGFRKVNLRDLDAMAHYRGTGGGTVKNKVVLPSGSLSHGCSERFSTEVIFPKNWSFNTKKYEGELEVEVSGRMEIKFEEALKPKVGISSTDPSPLRKGLVYSYPFIPRKITIPLNGKLPPCVELFILTCGGALAFLFGLIFYVFKRALPITITLKTDNKARAYKVRNNENISIGGSADFELNGCQEHVASIKREGSSFFLEVKKEGVLADSPDGSKTGRYAMHFGQSFNFNISGSYINLQFLEGDQEDTVSDQEPQVDTYDEGKDGFSF